MSRRTEQVSAVLQRSIQAVISRGLHDPRISGLITVTGVDVPVDMSKAVVHFTVIPVEREPLTRHGLQDASGFIRRQVGEAVRMRRVPDLVFKVDESAKEQALVLQAIARARAEFEEHPLEVDADSDVIGDADSDVTGDGTGDVTGDGADQGSGELDSLAEGPTDGGAEDIA